MLDDNVHPWNLRRFVRILGNINLEAQDGGLMSSNSTERLIEIYEVADKGHWFGDVMRGYDMQQFISKRINTPKPKLSTFFRIRAMHFWGTGQAGIAILQFISPHTVAWIDVHIADNNTWKLTTHSFWRFLGIINETETSALIKWQRKFYHVSHKVVPRISLLPTTTRMGDL
mmetsp:Transcript_33851/g.51027  ORF Transcript_33851/g.51027 Transcript_33851/m.51027 type:complete len:172 (+) Transcript_33851:1320-1835(+)